MDENLMPVMELWDPVISRDVRSKLPAVHRRGQKIDKDGYLQDIEGVYHAIGGFARLAHLANEDPKWFFSRFGDRLLPNIKEEHDVNITILPALARSPLDGEYTEVSQDGQHSGVLPGMRGGDDPSAESDGIGDMRLRSGAAPRREPLDRGSYQAPGSSSPGAGSSSGGEDSSEQDGLGLAFE